MNIYSAISAAMGDIEPIAKGRKNDKQGFMFRGIDEIMNELQPILKKHNIFVVPEVLECTRETKATGSGGVLLYSILKIKYTFYIADGSSVSAIVIGEGMDAGDKASNKAMSVGLKYALLQVFCIPTEDTKDPDGESHDVVSAEFLTLKNALIDYLEKDGIFEHPENVMQVIEARNIKNMKAALAKAKEREAAKAKD